MSPHYEFPCILPVWCTVLTACNGFYLDRLFLVWGLCDADFGATSSFLGCITFTISVTAHEACVDRRRFGRFWFERIGTSRFETIPVLFVHPSQRHKHKKDSRPLTPKLYLKGQGDLVTRLIMGIVGVTIWVMGGY